MRYEIWWTGITALKRKRINRCNILFEKPKWNIYVYIDGKTVLRWTFREENRRRAVPVVARSKTLVCGNLPAEIVGSISVGDMGCFL
jgi:hypothetical protein